MKTAGDLFVPGDSWLHRADPRVKMLLVAALWVMLLSINNLYIMVITVLLLHVLYWTAHIPKEKILFIWKALLPITILIPTIWAFTHPVGPLVFTFWILSFSLLGLLQGVALSLRIVSLAFAVFAWLYTSEPNALVRGLVKIKLPPEWGIILILVLRYLPTFQNLYRTILEAQQARGLQLKGSGFRRLRLLMPVFIAMTISVLRTSEQLGKALEARAFGAKGVQRTYLREIAFRQLDYLYTIIILGLTLALIYLHFQYGFGAQLFALIGR